MLRIHTGELDALGNHCQHACTSLSQLFYLQNQLSYFIPNTHVQYLTNLKSASYILQKDLSILAQHFQTTSTLCMQMEQQLQNIASNIQNKSVQNSSAFVQNKNLTSKDSTFKTEMMKFTNRFHTTFQKDRNLIGYLKNGACVGYFVGFEMFRGQYNKKMKYGSFGADVQVGSVDVSVDAKATLFKDGKIHPSLFLEANANAAIAQVGIFAKIGNDYLSAQGDANVKVGCASAEAKAVINRDELTMKASVGAAAIRGEVKGTINIFGVKISATGIGEVGSVGASAEFSSKKGEFEIGTKASFLAGLGFKIRVTY